MSDFQHLGLNHQRGGAGTVEVDTQFDIFAYVEMDDSSFIEKTGRIPDRKNRLALQSPEHKAPFVGIRNSDEDDVTAGERIEGFSPMDAERTVLLGAALQGILEDFAEGIGAQDSYLPCGNAVGQDGIRPNHVVKEIPQKRGFDRIRGRLNGTCASDQPRQQP